MDPHLGIFLGVTITLISGIVFGCVANNHTHSNMRRWVSGVIALLPGIAAHAFLVPDLGSAKFALFLLTAGIGAVIIPLYIMYLYIRTMEGRNKAMEHRIAAIYLGWKFRNRPYAGVQNQTGSPRNDPGIV